MGKIFLLFSLSAFSLGSYAGNCTYELKIGDKGNKYNSFQEFVNNEIRGKFENSQDVFDININQKCGNNVNDVSLKMEKDNFYIKKVNMIDLPKDIETYNNRLPLEINRNNFDQLVSETATYFPKKLAILDNKESPYKSDKKEKLMKQKILKMYAFVFAEAARFESVELAVKNSIDGECSTNWHNYDFTVHNWRNMSNFVVNNNYNIKELQKSIINNSGNNLLVPVLVSQELLFENHVVLNNNQVEVSEAGAGFDYSNLKFCEYKIKY